MKLFQLVMFVLARNLFIKNKLREYRILTQFTPGNESPLEQTLIPTLNRLEPPYAIYPYMANTGI